MKIKNIMIFFIGLILLIFIFILLRFVLLNVEIEKSARKKNYYNKNGYSFKIPLGWQEQEKKNNLKIPADIIFVGPQNDRTGFCPTIITTFQKIPADKNITLDMVLAQALKQLHARDFREEERKKLVIDGIEAVMLKGKLKDAYVMTISSNYYILIKSGLLQIVATAAEEEYDKYKKIFIQTIESIKIDDELKN